MSSCKWKCRPSFWKWSTGPSVTLYLFITLLITVGTLHRLLGVRVVVHQELQKPVLWWKGAIPFQYGCVTVAETDIQAALVTGSEKSWHFVLIYIHCLFFFELGYTLMFDCKMYGTNRLLNTCRIVCVWHHSYGSQLWLIWYISQFLNFKINNIYTFTDLCFWWGEKNGRWLLNNNY